jgi:glycosyltransferase involved in cell wall biosynthesis
MNILFFTWKDKKNPLSGGAESINEGIAKRLAKEGHKVTFLVSGYKNCKPEEEIDGYKVVRLGNRWTIYWHAYRWYKSQITNHQSLFDLIIEEINTVPFFTQLYTKGKKRVLIIYQLCRQIWFYQIFFPLSLIGYLIEPVYLFILNKNKCITESESTKNDLQKYEFNNKNISIIPIATDIVPLKSLDNIEKYKEPTMLSLGAIRKMKKTLDQIKAFEQAKKEIPELKLKVAGDAKGNYGQKILKYIKRSSHKSDIEYLGKINQDKKIELLQKCHIITVTSVKEGWGIIVTEAASQGTPAIVYNVDGLRDSVKNNETGIICDVNSPENLSYKVIKLLSNSPREIASHPDWSGISQGKVLYKKLQHNAWKWSKEFSWDKTTEEFMKIIDVS